MKTFDIKDEIFATVTQYGRELIRLRLSGVATLGELLGRLREMLGGVSGMVMLSLRNATGGWSGRSMVRIA